MFKKLYGAFFILLSLFALTSFFSSPAFAQTTLLNDNFNDGNSNDGIPVDWDESPGDGSWQVVSGKYVGTSASGTSGPISYAGDNTWTNYTLETDVTGLQGVDRHILFRYDPNRSVSGYVVKYRDADLGLSGFIELQKVNAGELGIAGTVLHRNESFISHVGETHNVKIAAQNNHIKVYVDDQLQIDYIDNDSPILSGAIGVFVQRSGVGFTNSTAYDDVFVATLDKENAVLPFTDNFQDGDSFGWNEYSPWGSWSVQNGEYFGSTILNSQPEKPSFSIIGNKLWQDYTFSVDVKSIQGVDKQIAFRIDESNRAYVVNLRSEFFNGGDDLVLVKKDPLGSSAGSILKSVAYDNSQNTSYTLKVDVKNVAEGVNIKISVDGIHRLEYTDTVNFISHGAIGLEVWPGGYELPSQGLVTTTAYDNIFVTELNNYLLLNVPYFAQGPYDSSLAPWANIAYDHYPDDDSLNTINRWGCAMTSAAMILNYYGHPTNPGLLNQWLKDNSGYIGWNTNWYAIPKLALDDYNASQEPKPSKVEFERYNSFDKNIVDSYLDLGVPSIVYLKNPANGNTHFVVIKGKDGSDYLINDPAYTAKTKLSDYPESHYSGLRVLAKSQTDLSYIVIFTDPEVDIKIFDPQDNEITGFTSIDDPYQDQVDGTMTIGNAQKVFSYPKPTQGNYKMQMTSTSPYSVNVLLYDLNGNITQQNIDVTDVSQPQTADLIISDQNEIVLPEPEPIIDIDTVIADWDDGYQQKLVKNKTVYKLIKVELELAKALKERNRDYLYKLALVVARKSIEKYTPRYIEASFSQLMKNNINSLLEVN